MTDHFHVLPQKHTFYVHKAHTLFLPLSLPHRHTVYTHENIRANVVSM